MRDQPDKGVGKRWASGAESATPVETPYLSLVNRAVDETFGLDNSSQWPGRKKHFRSVTIRKKASLYRVLMAGRRWPKRLQQNLIKQAWPCERRP